MPQRVAIDDMIAEVRREITMRGTTYQRLITAGKMKPAEATRKIEIMRAVLQLLIRLRAGERFRREG